MIAYIAGLAEGGCPEADVGHLDAGVGTQPVVLDRWRTLLRLRHDERSVDLLAWFLDNTVEIEPLLNGRRGYIML